MNRDLETTSASDQPDDSRLGTLLARDLGVSTQDLERTRKYADRKKLKFGEALVRLRLASAEDVRHALAAQFDYPYLRKNEGGYSAELVTAYKPFTEQSEKFRTLRIQLKLKWFSTDNKSIAVVSACEGEGKTFTAANLAVVCSQLGDKTVLIDANLHGPRLHKIFRLKNEPGLTPALVGRTNGTLSIFRVPKFQNLSVLPAGAIPPNHDEILARDEFGQILEQLEAEYDVVIIDTPPGNSGTGAENIAHRCGAALLVTRRDKTSLKDVEEFVSDLRARCNVVGSVLNNH